MCGVQDTHLSPHPLSLLSQGECRWQIRPLEPGGHCARCTRVAGPHGEVHECPGRQLFVCPCCQALHLYHRFELAVEGPSFPPHLPWLHVPVAPAPRLRGTHLQSCLHAQCQCLHQPVAHLVHHLFRGSALHRLKGHHVRAALSISLLHVQGQVLSGHVLHSAAQVVHSLCQVPAA